MVHLRDKLYAHKDLNGFQVESEIFNTVRAFVIDGSISLFSNELLPRGPKIQSLSQHVEKLVEHFETRAKALLKETRRYGCPSDGEYILNIDATSDDIFKPVPETEVTGLVKRLAEQVISPDR